jgi:hypothetical protein
VWLDESLLHKQAKRCPGVYPFAIDAVEVENLKDASRLRFGDQQLLL